MLQVSLICRLILETIEGLKPHRYLISVDEKTGMQALERFEQPAPVSQGGHTRREFEYRRHGTSTLMAALNVADGQLLHHYLHPTRKEEDFCLFIQQTAQPLLSPNAQTTIVFLSDQLNTHLSESLVRWVAQVDAFSGDLGKKGTAGILHSQTSRRAFLEQPTHRVSFVFTPTHCSWLNPVENWFAKLQKHVLHHGNFCSVDDLNTKVALYIMFYNRCLTKPLKWKFKGFLKAKELANFKLSNN